MLRVKNTAKKLAKNLNSQALRAFNQGDYVEAVVLTTKAINAVKDIGSKTISQLYYNRAAANQKLSNHANAINDLNEAIKLSPYVSHYYLGRAISSKALMQMHQISGLDSDTLNKIKCDLIFAKKYDDHSSVSVKACFELACLEQETGNLMNAIYQFEMAIEYSMTSEEIKPLKARIYLRAAQLSLQMNLLFEARTKSLRCLNVIASIDNKNEELANIYYDAVIILMQTNYYQLAVAALENFTFAGNRAENVLLDQAKCHFSLGHYAMATELLKSVAAKSVDKEIICKAHYYIGLCELNSERFIEAFHHFRESHKLGIALVSQEKIHDKHFLPNVECFIFYIQAILNIQATDKELAKDNLKVALKLGKELVKAKNLYHYHVKNMLLHISLLLSNLNEKIEFKDWLMPINDLSMLNYAGLSLSISVKAGEIVESQFAYYLKIIFQQTPLEVSTLYHEHLLAAFTDKQTWNVTPIDNKMFGDLAKTKQEWVVIFGNLKDDQLRQNVLWQALLKQTLLGSVFHLAQGATKPSFGNSQNMKNIALMLIRESHHINLMSNTTQEALQNDKALQDKLKEYYPLLYKILLDKNLLKPDFVFVDGKYEATYVATISGRRY